MRLHLAVRRKRSTLAAGLYFLLPILMNQSLVTYRIPFRETSWGTVTVVASPDATDDELQALADEAWLDGRLTYSDHEHEFQTTSKLLIE